MPKYYYDKTYLIVNVVQGIITFVKLKDFDKDNLDKPLEIAKFGIGNFQDKKGFFYFQKYRCFTNKISYMRWTQVWVFYALALLISSMGK